MKTITSFQDLLNPDTLTALLGDGVEFPMKTSDGNKSLRFRGNKEAPGVAATADCSGFHLSDVMQLGQLVAGANFDIIPSQVPLAGSLDLKSVRVELELQPQTKLSAVTIQIQSSKPWDVLGDIQPGLFVVKSLTFTFVVKYGDKLSLSCTASGKLAVEDIEFDVSMTVPGLSLPASLPAGQTVSLTKLLQQFLPHADLPRSFTASELTAEINPREQSYSFSATINQDWEVAGIFKLTSVKLAFASTKSSRASAAVTAKVSLAGHDFEFGGELDSAKLELPSWKLFSPRDKNSQPDEKDKNSQVDIASLLKDLQKNLKLDFALPAFLTGPTLGQVSLALDVASRNLSVRTKWKDTANLGLDFYGTQDKLGQALLLSYHNAPGASVDVAELVHSTGVELPIPKGLKITLQDALFAWCKPTGGAKMLFGLNLGCGLDLSQLPLVGDNFKDDGNVKLDFQIMLASQKFSADEVKALIPLFSAENVTLAPDAVDSGMSFHGTLQLAGISQKVELPVEQDTTTGEIKPDTSKPDDGVKWFALQKSFGPVHLERVGLKYQAGDLWLLLDAALALGGFSLALSGLGVQSPLTPTLAPTFHLDGLAVDFNQAGLEVGGTFLHQKVQLKGKEVDEYDGMVKLAMNNGDAQLALAGIGSYAQYEGDPSLFIYAALNYPIGGPPFFFVEGLAAGLGFNRSLVVPEVSKIADFPLVKEAMSGKPADTSKSESRAEILQQEVSALDQYVEPNIGAGFLAIGIKFSCFKLIDAFALLTAEVGDRLELDLLGLADMTVPSGGKGQVLARVQMVLKATILPAEGFLGISSERTSNSYILSKDCHLTGGFAFYVWMLGQHAGDFVFSMGGYHPRFVVPSHYPTVPRLGFNWQVDKHTVIKGGSYFALCAHALMAGGSMEASYNSGSAHAHFRVGADFLICWAPYHYDIDAYIEVSAKYGILGPVDVSVDLHIWGPDFSGTAKIHVTLFSFTIKFGSSSSSYAKAIDWSAFKGFLPADDKICSITVSSGVSRQLTQEGKQYWVVNPKQFVLATDASVPSNQAFKGTDKNLPETGPSIAIRPMALAADRISTEHRVIITQNGNPVEAEFSFTPVYKDVPVAMWGTPHTVAGHSDRLQPPDLNEVQFKHALTGFSIKPAKPPKPGMTRDIKKAVLQYNVIQAKGDFFAAKMTPFVSAEDSEKLRAQVKSSLDKNSTRDGLLNALGFDPGRDVQLDADALYQSWVVMPQIQVQP